MSGATPPRSPRGRRPAVGPRLGLERLEARDTPAVDLITSTYGNAAPIPQGAQVVGASDDGRYVIFQTAATNVIQNQVNPIPGAVNLFWEDTFTGELRLVSAERDPNANTASGTTPSKSGLIGGGVVPSTPGVTANAVISADGQTVAFVSNRNANRFDEFVTTAGVVGTFLDNGDATPDVFLWSHDYTAAAAALEAQGTPAAYHPTLVSRTQNITTVAGTVFGEAAGNVTGATNPAIGRDQGDDRFVSFVSTRNAGAFANSGILEAPTPAITVSDNGDNTPDLFQAKVVVNSTGTDAPTFTYAQVISVYSDTFSGATAFGKSAGFLQVDPLGRYLSSDGKSMVLVSNFNANLLDPTQPPSPAGSIEVYHLKYDQSGSVTAPPGNQFPVVTLMTSAPGLNGTSVGAQAFNAVLARNAPNTVVFSAIVPGGANSIVSGYVNQNGGGADLYVRDVNGLANGFGSIGTVGPASLVTAQAGSVTNGQNGLLDLSANGFTVSSDGSIIAFASSATNLAAGVSDTNGQTDVFVRNRPTGTTTYASVTPFGTTAGNGGSSAPRLNFDGSIIAFQSLATNLVPNVADRNNASDVFVRNLLQGRTALASAAPGGTQTADGGSFGAFIGGTATGGTVFFNSKATNLVEGFSSPAGVDQGYSVSYPLVAAGASGIVAVSGGVSGQAALAGFNADGSLNTQAAVTPFPGFNGAVRVATADVNGDGTPDLIVGAGPGAGPAVKVYDGATGALIYSFFPFESTFTGGVYVAGADFNGDGKAEIVVGAGENGGPRVKIFDGATGTITADLFVFEATFRGGVRVATGDVNGDGAPDLIVGAGLGGGPRVTVFSGASLAASPPALSVLLDFFAYEPSVRNGVFVGAGDANFDGKADIVTGAGPEGAPRVRVFDANLLLNPVAGNPGTLADFYAFSTDSRDGVRVALATINGQPAVVAGAGSGGPQVRTFSLGSAVGQVQPSLLSTQFAFDESVGFSGAWVG